MALKAKRRVFTQKRCGMMIEDADDSARGSASSASSGEAHRVARPDQYVSHVLPLDAHEALADFFAAILRSSTVPR